ncbi:isoamylase early set domain-containing protein [Sunxiuqinia dokdonensis]|uniref:Glycoside hydrolase n=1 Tax=Sunxiuqinia dokdonensis TaxID=1409788 RepID=A0A0L8V3S5_9BACT|nr:isoamylase early set domain-containing protein [Sunxiuqinia dokdonensis]KOH42877.1 glycoside hydrolase [Sunxiuqinia dokdonensis]
MSLKKQVLKSKPVCKVTFRVSKGLIGQAESVSLVGDFNGWDTAASPMSKLKTGEFTSQLTLEKGKAYEFRYLVDGQKWLNEPDADRFVANSFGEENSVIEAN